MMTYSKFNYVGNIYSNCYQIAIKSPQLNFFNINSLEFKGIAMNN